MRVWPTSSALLAIALATLTLAGPAGATSPTLPLKAAAGSALAGETGAGAEPETRIVGGAPAESASYPWQVELGINLKGGESFLCGGSLIHPYIVITAAHCLVNEFGRFERLRSVEVWLGRTLLSSGGELEFARSAWKPPLYIPVDNVPAANKSDFAFLVLPLAALQQRILIAGGDERALWTPGRIATVTGWGTTAEGGSLSPVLKEAQVPVVADGTCAEPIVYGAEFDPETMVCAGYPGGGTDSCQGDSGGPLESPIDGGGYRLTGIVSWGDGCARPGKPGVYTRIAGNLENTVSEMVAVIEREEGLPVLDVIGHGARPPGCGAAEAALAEASAELAAAQRAVAHGRQALRSAKRKLAAARRARRRAQRTGRRLGIVLRRLEVARLRVKLRRHSLNVARRGVATAAATVVTATGDRSAVCG